MLPTSLDSLPFLESAFHFRFYLSRRSRASKINEPDSARPPNLGGKTELNAEEVGESSRLRGEKSADESRAAAQAAAAILRPPNISPAFRAVAEERGYYIDHCSMLSKTFYGGWNQERGSPSLLIPVTWTTSIQSTRPF